jgi:hypothetical protein
MNGHRIQSAFNAVSIACSASFFGDTSAHNTRTSNLCERLTAAEADQSNEDIATRPMLTQTIFTTANTFRSDDELWPLLEQMETKLFGEERATVLLAF